MLAANYEFVDGYDAKSQLGPLVRPYVIINKAGLKIGIVGIANKSLMYSIGRGGNSAGLKPLDMHQKAQEYIDLIRDDVHILILLSHAGLFEDRAIINNVRGIDLLLGGHLHIMLHPP